jgi:hypothetical protein
MDSGKLFDEKMSRRGLIKGAAGVAGIAALTASGLGMFSKAEAKGGSTETWPWPYVKLDPAVTAELAYEEWYRGFCGEAVIHSIFSQLREKVGGPYNSFPVDAFKFLEGGMSAWGTVCGSNSGANVVTNCIIGPSFKGASEDGMLMGSEIMQWYGDAQMPVYMPKEPKQKAEIVKTVANSPLCHVSVGKWMKKSGYALGSPERRDRCARVAASVAYQTVVLLNDWKDGKYKTKGVLPAKSFNIPAQSNCNECHGTNIPTPPSAKKI